MATTGCAATPHPAQDAAAAPDGKDGGLGITDAAGLPPITPGQIDPRVFGKQDLAHLSFVAFSQTPTNLRDPQVLDLGPDLVPRAWARWDRWGLSPSDYDFGYPAACKTKGITFLGGTTASALFPDEVGEADFQDEVTRDAQGNPVPHPELDPITAHAYRATLASPGYRQRLVDIGKLQIDGGVDGLHYDEVLGGYTGANWGGGNEGFDDYHVADFGEYLCRKYAGAPSRLADTLGVTAADKLDCGGAVPGRTFDYRGYLARHGAQSAPLGANNPLAPDWGTAVNNRPDPSKGSFLETYPPLVYWQQIVLALRTYARDHYQREILISANGIFPFVDFQTVGLYDGNIDGPNGTSFNWVPVKAGHLDGSVSFLSTLRGLAARSKRVVEAGGGVEVPIVLFLDWPTANMDRYYALPVQERMDYFRLYAAEAYALGILFAMPLATTTDSHTASALGMMDFFKQLRAFYEGHADLYHGMHEAPQTPTVSSATATAVLGALPDSRSVLHIINHAYAAGVLVQHDVTATFPMPAPPSSVTLASPDLTADVTAAFTYANGMVTVAIGDLAASMVVVAK